QYSVISISVSNLDQTILTPVTTMIKCHYTLNSCPGQAQSIIVWTSELLRTCRLTRKISTFCIITAEPDTLRLTCPDINMSMTQLSITTICDRKMGYNAQGQPFTPDSPSDYPQLTHPSQIDTLTRVSINEREKRSAIKHQIKLGPVFRESEENDQPQDEISTT